MPVTDEIIVFALGPRNDQHSFRVALGAGERRTLPFLVYEYGKDSLLDLSGYSVIRLSAKQMLGTLETHVDVSFNPAWGEGRIELPISSADFTQAIASYQATLSAFDGSNWIVLGNGWVDVLAIAGMPPDPTPPEPPFAADWSTYFNGVDQVANGYDNLDWDMLNQDRTFCGWARFGSTGGDRIICAKGAGIGDASWRLRNDDKKFEFEYRVNDSDEYRGSSDYNVFDATNQWYHWALAVKGKGLTDIALYIDGAPVTWNRQESSLTGAISNSLPFFLGGGGWTGTDQSFTGWMDEFAIFERFLSPAEVVAIYNARQPKDLTPLAPDHWWRMGEKIKDGASPFPIVPDQGIVGGVDLVLTNMVAGNIQEETPW